MAHSLRTVNDEKVLQTSNIGEIGPGAHCAWAHTQKCIVGSGLYAGFTYTVG
jgi:hypothetical protein